MKTKFIWLIVSGLMVAALILASCAPAVVEEKKATVVTKEPEKKAEKVEEVVEEKVGPQYGGTIITFYPTTPQSWDREDLNANTPFWANTIYDSLLIVDWWEELPNRKVKLTNLYDYFNNPQLWTGSLTESWDWSDPLTMSFKIRKGVRWQNKPPANGREFVADDVVWYIERMVNNPRRAGQIIQNVESVTATDKYTVVFKLKEPNVMMLEEIGLNVHLECSDVFEQYGDFRDWKTLVGTGPWIIEDYVPDASVIYKRNPDYFAKDPEGNSLPYLDYFKRLIIEDRATQIAALRTAKIDKTPDWGSISWDQIESLKRTNPDLQFEPVPGGTHWNIWLKTTKEPTSNLKVRQALSMVVNRQELCDTLLGGTGHPFSYPALSSWPSYTPIEELPTNIREIYEWKSENVAKAKQLLADAGYPNGFEISCQYRAAGTQAPFAQGMEMVKIYWEEIGVDLDLIPIDSGTDAYLRNKPFAYDDLLATGGGMMGPLKMVDGKYRTGAAWNRAIVSDSYLDDLFNKAKQEFDIDKQTALYKELFLYVLEQCYDVAFPRIDGYSVWWPWVKGYRGEAAVSYGYEGHVVARIWVDQDLKAAK